MAAVPMPVRVPLRVAKVAVMPVALAVLTEGGVVAVVKAASPP